MFGRREEKTGKDVGSCEGYRLNGDVGEGRKEKPKRRGRRRERGERGETPGRGTMKRGQGNCVLGEDQQTACVTMHSAP